MSEKDITDAIKEAVEEYWETNKKPFMLSNIPPILKDVNDNYKDVLGQSSLKQFIETNTTDVKVVRHPKQKARIGLIPNSESFTYPEKEADFVAKEKIKIKNNENSATTLLDILSTLTEEELKNVSIPTSIFVKLYK